MDPTSLCATFRSFSSVTRTAKMEMLQQFQLMLLNILYTRILTWQALLFNQQVTIFTLNSKFPELQFLIEENKLCNDVIVIIRARRFDL